MKCLLPCSTGRFTGSCRLRTPCNIEFGGGTPVGNFSFLQSEWPDLHDEATRAEQIAVADPRASCFYARRCLEIAINWLFRADDTLRMPYREELAAKLSEPTLTNLVGPAIRTKMDVIRRQGNAAVHRPGPVAENDAINVVVELFQVTYWIAR